MADRKLEYTNKTTDLLQVNVTNMMVSMHYGSILELNNTETHCNYF
jgi:hypothetical protein